MNTAAFVVWHEISCISLHSFQFSRVSQPVKGVSQNINYTTTALLPVLTSLFDHIAQHQFGDDVIRKDL